MDSSDPEPPCHDDKDLSCRNMSEDFDVNTSSRDPANCRCGREDPDCWWRLEWQCARGHLMGSQIKPLPR